MHMWSLAIPHSAGLSADLLVALRRHQWVKEEVLAAKLQLHPKQLRRTLKALEEELLVVRRHRKEVWSMFSVKKAPERVAHKLGGACRTSVPPSD